MAKDPFELEKYLNEMNSKIQSLVIPYEALAVVDSPAIRIAASEAAAVAKAFQTTEKIIKSFEAQQLYFNTPEFKSVLSSILDVAPSLPQFEVAQQFRESFFDEDDSLTDKFDEFADKICESSPSDLWVKSDGSEAELSPQMLEAVRIVIKDVKKRSPLETAGIISGIVATILAAIPYAVDAVTWIISR